jgi:hypothetical protein
MCEKQSATNILQQKKEQGSRPTLLLHIHALMQLPHMAQIETIQ